MIGHVVCWVMQRRSRARWRYSLSRKSAYTDLALEAAIQAHAAAKGGYADDARILLALSEKLTQIGNSPDGKSALNFMRMTAHG